MSVGKFRSYFSQLRTVGYRTDRNQFHHFSLGDSILSPIQTHANAYRHVSHKASCQLCDKTKLVHRQPRDPIPRIYYGLIASGDQVIRSASIAAEVDGRVGGDILCFETEAAGIATEYSCIAIRGVSDYADSHKNDAWQYYAAAAAAGCAKELLSYIDLLQPFSMTEALSRHGSEMATSSCLATQSIFRGQGVQNSGSGKVSVGKDLNIGSNQAVSKELGVNQ